VTLPLIWGDQGGGRYFRVCCVVWELSGDRESTYIYKVEINLY